MSHSDEREREREREREDSDGVPPPHPHIREGQSIPLASSLGVALCLHSAMDFMLTCATPMMHTI